MFKRTEYGTPAIPTKLPNDNPLPASYVDTAALTVKSTRDRTDAWKKIKVRWANPLECRVRIRLATVQASLLLIQYAISRGLYRRCL